MSHVSPSSVVAFEQKINRSVHTWKAKAMDATISKGHDHVTMALMTPSHLHGRDHSDATFNAEFREGYTI